MVLRLPDTWSKWNMEMLVFEDRGKPEFPEKNLSEQRREPTSTNINLNLNPHMASTPGFEPSQTAGGECSHHCATLAPQSKRAPWLTDNHPKSSSMLLITLCSGFSGPPSNKINRKRLQKVNKNRNTPARIAVFCEVYRAWTNITRLGKRLN